MLLLLLRLSATALIASAQEGSTAAGLQLTGTRIRNGMNSHSPPIRRLSLADRTSDQYRAPKDKDEEEVQDDSDSASDSSTTQKAVSPVDISAISDDAVADDNNNDDDDAEDTDDATKSSSNHSTKSKRMHTTQGFNTTEPTEDEEPSSSEDADEPSSSNTTSTTSPTIPTVSQWDTPNVTFDPTNMTTNSTIMIPAEQTQPDSWPVIVFGIFALLAAGLCSATAIKNCKNSKRKNYDEIESLIV
jgi:cobalamin biosynthesis Mg chelatase CobN